MPRDHPRTCGEKRLCLDGKASHCLSPPHMRGKAKWRPRDRPKRGITPAHAGKRVRKLFRLWCSWDHPRACGEKILAFQPSSRLGGSPPRMRGKDAAASAKKAQDGITPAHAGKSPAVSVTLQHGKDHPRACGEKYSTHPKGRNQRGSPPRMRGKVPCIDFVESKGEDHPRACGEKIQGRLQGSLYRGSPPRMRGKEHAKNACCSWTRITPAHAGKSLSAVTPSLTAKDHPRACGEKMHFLNQMTSLWGSPPRMRGKDVACPAATAGAGITPAHAGKR